MENHFPVTTTWGVEGWRGEPAFVNSQNVLNSQKHASPFSLFALCHLSLPVAPSQVGTGVTPLLSTLQLHRVIPKPHSPTPTPQTNTHLNAVWNTGCCCCCCKCCCSNTGAHQVSNISFWRREGRRSKGSGAANMSVNGLKRNRGVRK